MNNTIHNSDDFEGMRKAGNLAASTLDLLVEKVKPGVSTEELDNIAFDYIVRNGGLIAPLFYKGYPKSVCTSINHVICHGIPSSRILENGDIVNIDVTVIVDGWHGDTSRMFYAGEPKVKARRLVDATYDAMMAGINAVKPGATLRDIGRAIQTPAEGQGFSVVRDFCGHGLGQVFHDAPNVVHYAEYRDRWGGVHEAPDTELRPGMFFTIEPMINEGKPDVKLLKDNWTAVSRDKSLSAQFEHSIGVTEDGFEIFTKSPKGLDKPPY